MKSVTLKQEIKPMPLIGIGGRKEKLVMTDYIKNNCPNCRQFITRTVTEERPAKTVNVKVETKVIRPTRTITLKVCPVTRNKTQKQILRIK